MWPNPQGNADLATFTEENFNGKLHFLCAVCTLVFFFLKLKLDSSVVVRVRLPLYKGALRFRNLSINNSHFSSRIFSYTFSV